MNREDFLKRKSTGATQDVTLTDGVTLKIRKMTQSEVEHTRRTYASPDKQVASLRYAVCRCVLDDDGSRMFEDGDLNELAGIDFDDINKIATAIGQFSGLVDDPKNG